MLKLTGLGDVPCALFAMQAARNRSLNSLLRLHLDHMQLGDHAVQALSCAFRHGATPALEALQLQRNRIHDVGPLFDALLDNGLNVQPSVEASAMPGPLFGSQLHELWLVDNPLSYDAVAAFARVLKAGALPKLLEDIQDDDAESDILHRPICWFTVMRRGSDDTQPITSARDALNLAMDEYNRDHLPTRNGRPLISSYNHLSYDLDASAVPHALQVTESGSNIANGVYILSAGECHHGGPVWRQVRSGYDIDDVRRDGYDDTWNRCTIVRHGVDRTWAIFSFYDPLKAVNGRSLPSESSFIMYESGVGALSPDTADWADETLGDLRRRPWPRVTRLTDTPTRMKSNGDRHVSFETWKASLSRHLAMDCVMLTQMNVRGEIDSDTEDT